MPGGEKPDAPGCCRGVSPSPYSRGDARRGKSLSQSFSILKHPYLGDKAPGLGTALCFPGVSRERGSGLTGMQGEGGPCLHPQWELTHTQELPRIHKQENAQQGGRRLFIPSSSDPIVSSLASTDLSWGSCGMLSAHQTPGQQRLGKVSRLGNGPGWKIFPGGSFSVGSELAGDEHSFPAMEWGCGLCYGKHHSLLRESVEVWGH